MIGSDRWRRYEPAAVRLFPLLLLSVYVFLVDLGSYPLQSWDEGWYAIQGQSVIERNALVATETFLHDAFAIGPQFKMPPLFAWLQTLSFSVFGYTEFATRLPSAAASIALAVVIYGIAAREFDRRTGWISSLVWLSIPHLFASAGGRQAIEDVLFTLIGTVFVYCGYRVAAGDEPRWLVPAGVFAGLSLLTKGLNAGIFVIVLAPLVVWRWRSYFHRTYTAACVGITALVGGFWPVYMTWKYGERFVHTFVVVQVFERATGGARGDPTFEFMNFPYLERLPSFLDPAIWFLVPALAYVAWRYRNRADRWKPLFLAWWGGSVFVFFLFTGTHSPYIYPMYVPVVIVVGVAIAGATRGESEAIAAVLVAVGLTLLFSPRLSLTPLELSWRGMWGRDPTEGILRLPAFLLLAGGALSWPTVRGLVLDLPLSERFRTTIPIALAVLLTIPLVAPATFPAPESQRTAGKWVSSQTDGDATIHVVPGEDRSAIHAFVFYSNRDITRTTVSNLANSTTVRVAMVPEDQLESVSKPVSNNMTVRTFGGRAYQLLMFERTGASDGDATRPPSIGDVHDNPGVNS